MTLRNKLLIVLSLAVVVGLTLSSLLTRPVAKVVASAVWGS
jgi:hypothetical protein